MRYLYIVVIVTLTILAIFSLRAKGFVKTHKEEILAIMYTMMSVWFSFVFLRPSVFKALFKYIRLNILYSLYLIIYIGVPGYFIYTAIKSYIDVYNKYKKKEEVKEEPKQIKNNNKKNKKNHK